MAGDEQLVDHLDDLDRGHRLALVGVGRGGEVTEEPLGQITAGAAMARRRSISAG